jgi:hypothetical protein
MSPVRARRIAFEALGEPLSRGRACRGRQNLAVVQPYLEVIQRGLDDNGRLEPFRLHALNRFGGQVIEKAQTVNACGPNIHVGALGVFVTEPLHRRRDREGILPFPQNHLAAITPDAEIETLAPHRTQLNSNQPLNYHGWFHATLFCSISVVMPPAVRFGFRDSAP